MHKPIIGITTGSGQTPEDWRSYFEPYARAVEDAGGSPVLLKSRHASEVEIAQVLDEIDGLLLSGGKDVHPSYYESRSEPGDADMGLDELIAVYGLMIDEQRDAFELCLTKIAYAREMPVFGICRGAQLLNVVLGGNLVKDIRTNLRHKACAESGEHPGESARHGIVWEPGSRIGRIVGEVAEVNSRHHQGFTLAEMADSLRAVATAPDGMVEAVEASDHPWALAVQWHPERSADQYIYEPCKALFRAFVEESA